MGNHKDKHMENNSFIGTYNIGFSVQVEIAGYRSSECKIGMGDGGCHLGSGFRL